MKDNKIIAEFMGYKNPSNAADIWYHYDTSWDWLMPVVNKCMQTGDNTDEWDALYDALSTVNITNTYDAVIEFIKQYNQNK